MINQRTLAHTATVRGVGVHTAEMVTLKIHPAPIDSGIVFNYQTSEKTPVIAIPATVAHISNASMSTTLTHQNISIGTVEHLLSALAGLGIDNARIEVDGSEIPIMDGSASAFIDAVEQAGIQAQSSAKHFLKIKRPVRVEQAEKYAMLTPFDGFTISFKLDYKHSLFHKDNQSVSLDFSKTTFTREVAKARTFGFYADYQKIKQLNLAKGASLDNTVVFDHDSIMNQEGLRYNDEMVRHKILDAIGDLYLLGSPLIGAFEGFKSGHALNHLLMQAVLKDSDNFEMVTFEESTQPPAVLY